MHGLLGGVAKGVRSGTPPGGGLHSFNHSFRISYHQLSAVAAPSQGRALGRGQHQASSGFVLGPGEGSHPQTGARLLAAAAGHCSCSEAVPPPPLPRHRP